MGPDPSSSFLTIGDLAGIRLQGPGRIPACADPDFHSPSGPGCPVLKLRVTVDEASSAQEPELVLDSGGLWKVWREGDRHVFELPHLSAVVDFSALEGTLHANSGSDAVLEYPLDEVLFSALLARREAVIVHACAVEHAGEAVLMCGASGAGKSTLSDLLCQVPQARILSDDRVVLWMRRGRPYVAGTPWHGTSEHACNRTAPCARILFLEHGTSNRIEAVSTEDAATILASMAVIPYWHKRWSEAALDVAVEACQRAPAARLAFVPDASAIECVLAHP